MEIRYHEDHERHPNYIRSCPKTEGDRRICPTAYAGQKDKGQACTRQQTPQYLVNRQTLIANLSSESEMIVSLNPLTDSTVYGSIVYDITKGS